MNKKQIIGISIFAVLIIGIIIFKVIINNKEGHIYVPPTYLYDVYVATGGGKEDFLADEEVIKILREKYNINPIFEPSAQSKRLSFLKVRYQLTTLGALNLETVVYNTSAYLYAL